MENISKNPDTKPDKRLLNLRPPFKKGEKPPKGVGHPKGQRNFSTIYRLALEKLAKMNDMTPEALEEDMISKGIIESRKGQYHFYKDTLDRLHGTAVQKQEVNATVKVEKLEEIQNATKKILNG